MMATSPRKGQRLAAPNPRRNPPSAPTPELPIDTSGRLSPSDWHLLFDAVMCRLLVAAHSPAAAAVVVPECVDALERLRGMLDLPSSLGR